MLTRLPKFIEPSRLADRGARLTGTCELSVMTRLAASLCERDGTVAVNVLFASTEERVAHVEGEVKARLRVLCQRCLEPMDLTVDARLKLAFLADGKPIKLAEGYEPLPASPGPISLTGLIEDELILALPISPMHALDECRAACLRAEPAARGARKHPFAMLAKLRACE